MEIMMSHTFYFHFHLISKSFFSFLSIWSVCSSKIYWRKDTIPNYFEFSNNQTRIGRFFWFQKSYKGKFYFEPCFQLSKNNDLGQFEQSQQVYLSEKDGEALSRIRKTVTHDAENLGLVPIYEAKSGKESTMDQELENGNGVYEIATWGGCVSQSRSTFWTSHPTFRFDSFMYKRMKQWNKFKIHYTNSKNCPKFLETLCLLIIASLNNALWCFVCLLIEILLLQNYLLSLKCTFRARISEEKSDKT